MQPMRTESGSQGAGPQPRRAVGVSSVQRLTVVSGTSSLVAPTRPTTLSAPTVVLAPHSELDSNPQRGPRQPDQSSAGPVLLGDAGCLFGGLVSLLFCSGSDVVLLAEEAGSAAVAGLSLAM
jgi:hypothetical protein